MKLNRQIYIWLNKIAKVPEGNYSPKWIRFIGYFLFPMIRINGDIIHVSGDIIYDWERDIIKIYGIKYSMELFRQLGFGLKENDIFRFVKKENGIITLEKALSGIK